MAKKPCVPCQQMRGAAVNAAKKGDIIEMTKQVINGIVYFTKKKKT